MAKKAKFGVNTYIKRDRPRKRPGRHTKRLNKNKKRMLKKSKRQLTTVPRYPIYDI